jgi:hypothetical protein
VGLFSKIGKALKKVVKKVGKGIKKVVKKVGKVVKKVTKSKLFKAIATIGAIVVTGGAALSAFGATGGAGTFTGWMMSKSAAITGGTLFGQGAQGLAGFGNTVTQLMSKPFEYVGSAIGSGARAVTDFTGITTPAPTTPAPASTTAAKSSFWDTKAGKFVSTVGTQVVGGVATGYATQELLGGDPTGEMAGLAVEGRSPLDPLAVYAPTTTISLNDVYGQLGYGTGDPGFQASAELFRQETLGVA